MFLLALILSAAAVVYTGPACEDLRARRRARRDWPRVRVEFVLQSAVDDTRR